MKNLLMVCSGCDRYTLKERCSLCGNKTTVAHPARYSPDDRYARYRSPLAYQEQNSHDLVD